MAVAGDRVIPGGLLVLGASGFGLGFTARGREGREALIRMLLLLA